MYQTFFILAREQTTFIFTMYKYLFLFCLVVLAACKTSTSEKVEEVNKGIAFELAQQRKTQLNNIVYNLHFSIPETKDAPIPTELVLDVNLIQTNKDLILDFNEKTEHLKKLVVNKKETPIHHQNEHIIINKSLLKQGANSIEISFNAGELSLNRNNDYLYTLLVPDRASTLFPCFDQPNLKANYKLTITAPKDWKVLCGAFENERIEKGNFVEHRFNLTDKMSTYLFSFVAGKFSEEIRNPGAFNMRFLYRETDSDKINESLPTIFKTHQSSLEFLEQYTGTPFPFQKMDFATLPPFQYGGMEHTGAIQYREGLLFLDENATQTRKLNRAKLIAHETSHMWFGNLVTMQWFNDVWMKEVFANFMADKIMNPVFPEVNHDLNFMMSHYPSAYSEDRTKGTNPIRQHLDNLKNAGSLYGRIIYNKAPIMMRQLELLLGPEAFQKGIQKYIAQFANDNADWNDLVSIFDELSAKDIKKWSEVWVHSPGRPVIKDSITYTDNRISSFNLIQHAEDGSEKIWEQSFAIGLVYDHEIISLNTNLSGKTTAIKEAIGLQKPKAIIYNYDGLGYGIFPNTDAPIQNITNDVARGYSYINSYENMLHGNTKAQATFETFLSGIASEQNELITNYLSSSIASIFWKFLPEEQQNYWQPIAETKIFELLQKELPKNIKRTLYGLYTNLAYSNDGLDNLYNLWSGKAQIKEVPLNESDLTNLAMKLAIYKHPKSEEIVATQAAGIKNVDKKERFNWLLPSISNDEDVRDQFMLSLKEASNREKESWVETALANIHHPLRQTSSIKHLPLCLELLEEIQLTGDIFFPKRWLTGSLGNYTSKDAYNIVQSFIKENPEYNPILLKKLLIVADNLERAQHINQ